MHEEIYTPPTRKGLRLSIALPVISLTSIGALILYLCMFQPLQPEVAFYGTEGKQVSLVYDEETRTSTFTVEDHTLAVQYVTELEKAAYTARVGSRVFTPNKPESERLTYSPNIREYHISAEEAAAPLRVSEETPLGMVRVNSDHIILIFTNGKLSMSKNATFKIILQL